MSTRDPVDGFLTSRSGLAPGTIGTYGTVLSAYRRWRGSDRIDKTSYDRYIAERARLGRRPNGTALAATVLRGYAEFRGQRTDGWQRPRNQEVPWDVLRAEEFPRLVAACDGYDNADDRRFVVEFLFGTQLRISELMALRWADVDLVERVLSVRRAKGGHPRRVRLFRLEWRAARDRLSRVFGAKMTPEEARLLPDRVVGFDSRLVPERWLAQLARDAGLEVRHITPHGLRHAGAVALLKRGMDLRTLQLRLGHRSLEMTARYLQIAGLESQREMPDLDLSKPRPK